MTAPVSYGTLFVSLLGGLGLFLLGMTMLTDGLKLAAGRALERMLEAWTRTWLHGLFTGVLLTALVQSSTAMTVAAIGFVNAGLLSFTSALWVVFGSNFGSTVTGWLVAWLGFKLKIDAFALPFIGIGMALKLTGEGSRRGALGMAVAGFGLLFLGIDMLKQGFEGLGPQALPSLSGDAAGVALSVLVGMLLTIVLQASSATLALALTAVGGGMMPVEAGAGIVVGANVGTTLTAILAAIGATSNARRLAAAHVLFNVLTAVVALAVFSPLLDLIHALGVWLTGSGDAVMQLVLFHSLFNLLGVLLMLPLSAPLVRFLLARFRSADEDAAAPATWTATWRPCRCWRCRRCAMSWRAWAASRLRWRVTPRPPMRRAMFAWPCNWARWSICSAQSARLSVRSAASRCTAMCPRSCQSCCALPRTSTRWRA